MTDLPFVSALVQADLPVWEQCLQTEFLQKMENGTLSEDCFKSYLVEDSLYLREYAKIFAWGMTKAPPWRPCAPTIPCCPSCRRTRT